MIADTVDNSLGTYSLPNKAESQLSEEEDREESRGRIGLSNNAEVIEGREDDRENQRGPEMDQDEEMPIAPQLAEQSAEHIYSHRERKALFFAVKSTRRRSRGR